MKKCAGIYGYTTLGQVGYHGDNDGLDQESSLVDNEQGWPSSNQVTESRRYENNFPLSDDRNKYRFGPYKTNNMNVNSSYLVRDSSPPLFDEHDKYRFAHSSLVSSRINPSSFETSEQGSMSKEQITDFFVSSDAKDKNSYVKFSDNDLEEMVKLKNRYPQKSQNAQNELDRRLFDVPYNAISKGSQPSAQLSLDGLSIQVLKRIVESNHPDADAARGMYIKKRAKEIKELVNTNKLNSRDLRELSVASGLDSLAIGYMRSKETRKRGRTTRSMQVSLYDQLIKEVSKVDKRHKPRKYIPYPIKYDPKSTDPDEMALSYAEREQGEVDLMEKRPLGHSDLLMHKGFASKDALNRYRKAATDKIKGINKENIFLQEAANSHISTSISNKNRLGHTNHILCSIMPSSSAAKFPFYESNKKKGTLIKALMLPGDSEAFRLAYKIAKQEPGYENY